MSKFWIAYIVPGLLLFAAVFATPATGATKAHAVSFGKWTAIKWCVGRTKVRAMT
jgi:hypothetical protein